MNRSLRADLDDLLGSSKRLRPRGEDVLWDHLARQGEVVIFGAGNLGRQVGNALTEAGVKIACFSDNQQKLWHTEVQSIEVLPPREAVGRYGSSAYFVISIWHPAKKSDLLKATDQLRLGGAKKIAPFSLLLQRFPRLLPRMFWGPADDLLAHADEIAGVFDFLADDVSRQYLLNALRLRLFHDFEAANFVAEGRQYFPHDVYRVREDETFVDCGAYDGDSVADFLAECSGKFREVIAFEADPKNAEALRKKVRELNCGSPITVREEAVGAHDGTIRFSAEGAASASVCEAGGVEVRCSTLDTALAGKKPTIIKMDIEGAESAALDGARTTMGAARSILAVCVYHRPEDIWQLPAKLRKMMPDSNIYLRSHCSDGFDLVCYAVPDERDVELKGSDG